jgi:hypothetical protein
MGQAAVPTHARRSTMMTRAGMTCAGLGSSGNTIMPVGRQCGNWRILVRGWDAPLATLIICNRPPAHIVAVGLHR